MFTLFSEESTYSQYCVSKDLKEYDSAIEGMHYKVIPVNDNEESRIVDFLYGGD